MTMNLLERYPILSHKHEENISDWFLSQSLSTHRGNVNYSAEETGVKRRCKKQIIGNELNKLHFQCELKNKKKEGTRSHVFLHFLIHKIEL